MLIDMRDKSLERDPETTDFSDLTTTSGAVRNGPSRWATNAEGVSGFLDLPFSPEAAESERWPITRRLITKDAEEESLYIQAENARSANATWRTGTSVTIGNNASAIEGTTGSFTAVQASDNIRGLATGVRLLNDQLAKVTSQNENIIYLLLKLMNQG